MIKESMLRDLLPSHYINADDMMVRSIRKMNIQELSMEEINKANMEAATFADQLRQDALLQGKSFTTETVLSTPAKINLMRQAKERGYLVHLWYVLTQNPVINIYRVSDRVLKGGHDVPADKIETRYAKALALLPTAINVADSAVVIDNSSERPALIQTKATPFLGPAILNEVLVAVGTKAIQETHSTGQPSFHADRTGMYWLYLDGRRVYYGT